MSVWALLGLVVVMVLVAGLALLLTRRGVESTEDLSRPGQGVDQAASRRTVAEFVREQEQQRRRAAAEPEPAMPAGQEGPEADGCRTDQIEGTEPLSPDGVSSPSERSGGRGAGGPENAEPRVEYSRPGVAPVDVGPVGPPWNRGFIDGVPVEAPCPAVAPKQPRPQPERRTPVDPALVARVTSVRPPEPAGRSGEAVVPGYVSPAVAEAVARAEAQRSAGAAEPPAAVEPSIHPAPSQVHNAQSAVGVTSTARVPGPDADLSAAEEPAAAGAAVVLRPVAEPADADTDVFAKEEPAVLPEPLGAEEAARAEQTGDSRDSMDAHDTTSAAEAEEIAGSATVDELAERVKPEPADESATANESVDVAVEQVGVDGRADVVGADQVEDLNGTTEPVSASGPEGARGDSAADGIAAGDVLAGDADADDADADDADAGDVAADGVAEDGAAAWAAARTAEHAAVDLALLRTLGFADPNPRPGTAPVVDMSVDHSGEEEEPVDEAQAVPVRFRVWGRERVAVPDPAATLLDARGKATATATGDGAGTGTVVAPRAGNYVLVAAGTGYQPGVVALTVGEEAVEVDVQLTRSSSVSGTVSWNGAAPPTVTLLQDGEVLGAGEVDEAGAYRFADLAAGEYTVAAVVRGAGPVATVIRLGEEQDEVLDIAVPAVSASMSG